MTAAHALFIGFNLLLAVVIYMMASSARRIDALHVAIIGGFLSIGVLDIWLTVADASTTSSLALIILLDALLVAFVATYLLRERSARIELERQRDDAAALLTAEREARALALRDRCGNAF